MLTRSVNIVRSEMPKSLNVLVVDDDQVVLTMISDQLKELYPSAVINLFKNPAESLYYYRDNFKDIDIVIIDMIMPEMGGLDLSREIVAINPLEKIILLSAYSIEKMIAFEGAGMIEHFLTKNHLNPDTSKISVLDYYIRKTYRAKTTQIKRSEAERELKKLTMVIEKSLNVIIITDIRGDIEYVNPKFTELTGYAPGEVIGQNPDLLTPGFTDTYEYKTMLRELMEGKTWQGVMKILKKDGETFWANTIISPVIDDNGDITHFLSVMEDITEKKNSVEKEQYLSSFDETTGLYNRSQFVEMLNMRLANLDQSKEHGALLLIDIDDFLYINDTYGHGVGDAFLQQVASLLRNCILEIEGSRFWNKNISSTLARLGADEFAVLIAGCNVSEAMEVAEQIRKEIEKYHYPGISAGETETASIGVALYPEHAGNTSELLTRADTAVYRAKKMGPNQTYLFSPESGDAKVFHSRRLWREQIQKALDEDRFEPWFQPILDLRNNEIHHYEALARMRDEEGKIVMPGAFIEVAERYKLIGSIDRVMTEKVMHFQAEIKQKGRDLSFGMNISGKDLGNEEFLSSLMESIDRSGADPNRLVFEITETAAVKDLDTAKKFIKALKAMGCKFSLDDFGVGFTSFLYLREMEIDYIKIDGYFIKKLDESPNDQLFVRAITDVARGLGIETVAEFVETEETLAILRELGVDYAQGYLIGKPGPEILDD